ncbi:MAG: acyl-ACP--UDP-N-acetylglucosamine O-acyltransferase [bacterium]|nr:acyl-ACP--UDP-N-acetylglucosamine O-acyltransferase [bacterium]
MTTEIHPTAIVDPGARLDDGVVVGPYAIIGPEVEIGAGTRIEAGGQVQGPSRIGRENRIFPYACVGFEPQDLKFGGEETRLEVGDRNQFREHCTVHRGTGRGGGLTTIGDDNLFMVFTHVAHDCHVGNRTVFSNNGTLAGHVVIEDDATVGAFSAVHQFCRVGRHAYIGGYSVITRDALPFVKTVGGKPACYGLNRVGLERKGFSPEVLERLEAAYRILVRSKLNTSQALERLGTELSDEAEVRYLAEFVAGSQRGVIKELPRRPGQRGG